VRSRTVELDFVRWADRELLLITLPGFSRILTQWSDQLYYLQRHRGFPWGLSHLFLLINVIVRAAVAPLL
jgi:hypothetical protein